MAWTADDIADLKAAIAAGVLTVSRNGKTVTYRSLDDMIRTLRLMESEVAGGRPARWSKIAYTG